MISIGFGGIIHVPDDWGTIQAGIDAATENDTVLVVQGTYYENLIIKKDITLASHAIYDDLTNWAKRNPYTGEFEVLNENIYSTIIDGSDDTNGEQFQSVILINSPDNQCIEPVIIGFTITGGDGTQGGVEVETLDGIEMVDKRFGGGVFSYNALPEMHYNYVKDNWGDPGSDGLPNTHDPDGTEINIDAGGAFNSGTGIDFGEELGASSNNLRCEGNVNLSHNFYRDNDALYGNTLATNTGELNTEYDISVDMTSSIFDVYDCENEEVPPYWLYSSDAEVDTEGGDGDLCINPNQSDYYVSVDGDDNFDGTEDFPFLTIEMVFTIINPDENSPVTIYLSEGTFSPSTTGENFPLILISNVSLIGQGEDITIVDAEQTSGVIIMDQNNFISELTITGGIAEYAGGIYISNSNNTILTNVLISGNMAHFRGGGIYIIGSSPTFLNVTLRENIAGYYGGGMDISNSSPTLTNILISENTAGYRGGGIYLYNANPTLFDVTISENTAGYRGGGMDLYYANPILENMIISGNTVLYNDGGGMHLYSSYPTLTNVTISRNTANDLGGGLYLDYSDPILRNVTISKNVAGYFGGGIYMYISNPIITNTIIWNNIPESIFLFEEQQSSPIMHYSDIEGEWEGEGNINANPLFTDPENGDFNLQEGSPCIDSGTADIDGDGYDIIDFCGTAPDMGAYEYITEDCDECNVDLADVNGDGLINILDLVQISNMILEISTPAYECAADYNGDGEVNILDLVQIANMILDN